MIKLLKTYWPVITLLWIFIILFSSCVSYYPASYRVESVLAVTSKGDTIQMPLSQIQKQYNHDRFNNWQFYYGNNWWLWNDWRFYYPNSNIWWNTWNRPIRPIYRNTPRPKVRPRTQPRPRVNPRSNQPTPRGYNQPRTRTTPNVQTRTNVGRRSNGVRQKQ